MCIQLTAKLALPYSGYKYDENGFDNEMIKE